METDTGCTAADVVAALREMGVEVEVTQDNWPTLRKLACLFNIGTAQDAEYRAALDAS